MYQSRVVIEGKRQIQSAFLVSGKATYLTQPATPGMFGENLQGVWYGVPKKNIDSRLQQCPNDLLPAGTRRFSSGQEKDAVWHFARVGWITSRSAYNLIHTVSKLRLPINQKYSTLLRFIGFEDYCPPAPCLLTPEEINSLKPKETLAATFRSYGGIFSKGYNAMTVSKMKEEFIAFVSNPPPPLDPATAWKKLAPVLFSSMLLKPLDPEKISALQKGMQNQKLVLQRLRADLNTLGGLPIDSISDHLFSVFPQAAMPKLSMLQHLSTESSV